MKQKSTHGRRKLYEKKTWLDQEVTGSRKLYAENNNIIDESLLIWYSFPRPWINRYNNIYIP